MKFKCWIVTEEKNEYEYFFHAPNWAAAEDALERMQKKLWVWCKNLSYA